MHKPFYAGLGSNLTNVGLGLYYGSGPLVP